MRIRVSEVGRQAREAADDAIMLARLGRDLPGYLRAPLTVDEARRQVSRNLERREQRLLDLVDRAIYGNARSPYRRLLANVGCEAGDFRAFVRHEGIEGALRRLADQGVYVTYEELKGRQPAVRSSVRFTFHEDEFDNPLADAAHLLTYTGGSGGRPSRIRRTLASLNETAAPFALALEAHGITRWRTLFWIGGSLAWPLMHLKLGQPIEAWLRPTRSSPWVVRAGLGYAAALVRLANRRLLLPEYCS